ncbi:MAG: helix-turn-helix transcriptional regulator [Candidatus Peregrinibacteria bacterium]|nr:helix-turn-helix transcriptional regulator [Candidatus Peregrinibacteria bacterium]
MNDTTRKEIGKRIKQLREQLGLSQLVLAQMVGKSSAAYIAFIESGERNISTMDMMVLAKKLGTTVSELLSEPKREEKPTFMRALRSSKDLSEKDKQKITEFYEFLKSKNRDE